MPPASQDYYTLLGILRSSSPEEIKRAYYAAARRFHPDRNMLPGETELFLEVQRAYEVLSNSERRALYDATLPDEQAVSGAQIELNVQYSRQSLVHLDEPQLVYALLEVRPSQRQDSNAMAPLNLCLVLDRSTSMQGQKADVAKAAAIRILNMLRPEDLFGLVVFSDRAEVLLPSGYQHELNKAQSRIQAIRASGATEILQGLRAGMAELLRGLNPSRGNHLILLTDGHTYGDEQACLQLADEAARQDISISGFGLGGDWNDIFLDSLVGRTGGNSNFISEPQDIEAMLAEKFNALARILVDDALLEFQPAEGIQLRCCYRLHPQGGPITLDPVLRLGPILQNDPLSVLFEFVIEPAASRADSVTLLDGTLRAVAAARPMPFPPMPVRLDRPAAPSASADLPPEAIVSALSRLSLYRLQERAREEVNAGQFEPATRHLRNLARQLQAQGHHDLSKTTLFEAETIERLQAFSGQGSKQIKYGTRALLEQTTAAPE